MANEPVVKEIKPDVIIDVKAEELDKLDSVDAIKALLHQSAAEQNIQPDSPTAKPAAKPAAEPQAEADPDAPQVFSDTFSIGGKDYTFSSDSPAGINAQV